MTKLRAHQVLVTFNLVFCVLFTSFPARAQNATPIGNYTYADCRTIDKQQLRSEIERHAKDVLDTPANPIDIDALVARKWAELGVDATINGEVERAVNQVRQDEGYWSRLWSGWSPDKADEFARRIISDTFNSPVFAAKLDELSTNIGNEIARQVQSEFARAASVAFLCLQEYVGERYSATLFSAFEDNVRLEAEQIDLTQATEVNVDALDVHGKALTGVGLIVVSEIARRVAIKLSEKIAERVAGKIIGRVLGKAGSSLIPVAGWVIGIGLIVWDLWEGGQGALPQIQEALTSEDVKVKIRSEIATSIKDGLPQEGAIAAVEISASLIDEWDGFCSNNRYLCLVADENPGMRSLLDYVPLADLRNLSTWVDVIITSLGRSTLDAAIDNGQLEQVLSLPIVATMLVSETHSLETTLAWSAIAKDRLASVVEYGVYQHKLPADFDSSSLAMLLDIADAQSIGKLSALDTPRMLTLLALPAESISILASAYSAADLTSLADVLSQPQVTPVATLAAQVAKGETTIEQLQTYSATQATNSTESTSSTSTNGTTTATSPSFFSTLIESTSTALSAFFSSVFLFLINLSVTAKIGSAAVSVGLIAVLLAFWLSRKD